MDFFIDLRDMAFVHWRFFFFFFSPFMYCLAIMAVCILQEPITQTGNCFCLETSRQQRCFCLDPQAFNTHHSLLKRLQSLPVLLSFCFKLFLSTFYLKLYISYWILLCSSVDDYFDIFAFRLPSVCYFVYIYYGVRSTYYYGTTYIQKGHCRSERHVSWL